MHLGFAPLEPEEEFEAKALNSVGEVGKEEGIVALINHDKSTDQLHMSGKGAENQEIISNLKSATSTNLKTYRDPFLIGVLEDNMIKIVRSYLIFTFLKTDGSGNEKLCNFFLKT